MLSAASWQSLMAFQMSMQLDMPPPCIFITDLIKLGHARFLPSDPDGLFVKWAREAYGHYPKRGIHVVMDFLCPLETTGEGTQIAGGLLAPGEEARGELRRLVQSFDSQTKMNILHHFVAYGIVCSDTNEILKKLRMLHHVYGLSVLTPTQDRRTVGELAAESRSKFSNQMKEAITMAIDEELLEQRRALAAVRGLALLHLPSLPIKMIGKMSRLPLGIAESINEDCETLTKEEEHKEAEEVCEMSSAIEKRSREKVSNTEDDCLQRQIAKKIFTGKSKIEGHPVSTGLYIAFKYCILLATNF